MAARKLPSMLGSSKISENFPELDNMCLHYVAAVVIGQAGQVANVLWSHVCPGSTPAASMLRLVYIFACAISLNLHSLKLSTIEGLYSCLATGLP